MSAATRTHRPNQRSPRLSRNRGITVARADGTAYSQDRVRWPASSGTFRYADMAPGGTTTVATGGAGKYGEVPS